MRRMLLSLVAVALVVPAAVAQYSVTEFSVTIGAQPSGITVGHDGNIWFTESGLNRIGKLDPKTGNVVEYLVATASAGLGRIIAGQSGAGAKVLYFVEQNANKIGVFDLGSGTVTSEHAVPTASAGLTDIAQGPDGNVYFTETTASKIGRLTVTGFVTEFATTTASAQPGSIAAGKTGYVYFSELAAGKVGALATASGSVSETAVLATATQPFGAGVTSDNELYTVDAASHTLYRRCMESLCSGSFTAAATFSTPGVTQLIVAPDNSVWAVDPTYDVVFRVDPSGTIMTQSLQANSSPSDLVAGPDGNIWVAERGRDKIARINVRALPGDANKDGLVTVGDIFFSINYLFAGGPQP